MSVPVINAAEWTAKLMELPRRGAASVTAFYEHRMGAICRDPRLLLVPLDDHMVHRGDAIFESLTFLEGRIVQLDAHLERMKHSASTLSLLPPCPWEEVRSLMLDVAKAGGEPYGGLKVLLGRGCGGLGVDPAECLESSLYIVATRGKPLPGAFWQKGLTAARSAIPAKQEWLARIKSTNYLANALMAKEAREQGVDLTFSFDDDGFLAEAAIANVALVDREGRMLMPRFRHALPGTTAIRAMEIAKSFMPVVITDITEEIVEQASEILVLGTTCECVAVTHYNGKPVGDGRPGPMADRLRHLLHDALVTGGVPFLQ
ncbi:aminotransferase class IV [uncultured Mailhella sp.]|uniref:aminotransferase class IV n=1 Tax=uncultured Mailhella sp. TaxID=1981031 RepID=UPI0025FA4720|nr:aminotransferase class IV [uncultured Mailhella sp.]